mmetsp:Transcript_31491/g.54591  ORF Transcript_31491/g.54591 Transcript_31491/m.54591 type:complete len:256 (+) Transcript_31491:49-816(+)
MDSSDNWTRPIDCNVTRATLWTTADDAPLTLLSSLAALPRFQVAPDVMLEIWRQGRQRSVGKLACFRARHMQLNVEEVHWDCSSRTGDLDLEIRPEVSVSEAELDGLLSKIQATFEIGIGKGESKHPSPYDMIKALATYRVDKDLLTVRFLLVYPKAKLVFRPVFPIKLVASPLSRELTQGRSDKFRSGFLTMDSARRLLPLLASDPSALSYPLVGLWVAGIPQEVCFIQRVPVPSCTQVFALLASGSCAPSDYG